MSVCICQYIPGHNSCICVLRASPTNLSTRHNMIHEQLYTIRKKMGKSLFHDVVYRITEICLEMY
jgi:hypothetical protein